MTGSELMRQEPDGTMVRHADLTGITPYGWNEIVVDGRGNIYVNSLNFDFGAGEAPAAGIIALVTPDGTARQVADGIEFPNGMLVTPDNAHAGDRPSPSPCRLTAFDIAADGSLSNRRVWADGVGPDGICIDADGAIWTGSADTRVHTGRDDRPEGTSIRVREGGEELARVEFDRAGFACMLGGPDGRTLFTMAAEWRGIDQVGDVIARRTGQVLVSDAPSPGVGWP